MNLSEAISVYLANPIAENIVLGQLKLITDRGTKRIYSIDGGDFRPNIDQLASNDWEVILNQ